MGDFAGYGDAMMVVGVGLLITWLLLRPTGRTTNAPKLKALPVQAQPSGFSHVVSVWLQTRVEHARIAKDAEIQRQRAYLDAQIRATQQAGVKRQVVEQVVAHSIPQAHSNQLANYMPAEPEVDALDEFRQRLLLALVSVYEEGRMADDGRIVVTAPWSKRGGFSPKEMQRAKAMFEQARLISGVWVVQQRDNAWYVNRKRFASPGQLVRAFALVKTPA